MTVMAVNITGQKKTPSAGGALKIIVRRLLVLNCPAMNSGTNILRKVFENLSLAGSLYTKVDFAHHALINPNKVMIEKMPIFILNLEIKIKPSYNKSMAMTARYRGPYDDPPHHIKYEAMVKKKAAQNTAP